MRKIHLLWFLLLLPIVAFQQQSTTKPESVTVIQHTVTVTWTRSTTPSSELSGYHVWRTTTSGSGYVIIGTTAATANSFIDNTVIGGNTYYYVTSSFGPACPATPVCGESTFSNEIPETIPLP